MIQSGIYTIPLADYVRDPAPGPSLSSGIAHTLLTQSARHAWFQHARLNPVYESDESSRLDLGTIAHALLLEDDESKVVIIEAEDWRTKLAREQRDEARRNGLLPILMNDMSLVRTMIATARTAIQGSEISEAWGTGTSEQTLVWEDNDIWCRSRPDRASKDWRVLFDYKTTQGSASPHAFTRTILQHGYDLQAALALRGVEQGLQLADPATFVFIVQEMDLPYAVSFVSLSPHFIEFAKVKLSAAMSVWKGCLRTGQWPSYPSRIAYLDPPAYAGNEYELPQDIEAEDVII